MKWAINLSVDSEALPEDYLRSILLVFVPTDPCRGKGRHICQHCSSSPHWGVSIFGAGYTNTAPHVWGQQAFDFILQSLRQAGQQSVPTFRKRGQNKWKQNLENHCTSDCSATPYQEPNVTWKYNVSQEAAPQVNVCAEDWPVDAFVHPIMVPSNQLRFEQNLRCPRWTGVHSAKESVLYNKQGDHKIISKT